LPGVASCHAYQKLIIWGNFTVLFLSCGPLKRKLGVFLGGHTVAVVACCVVEVVTTCSPVLGRFFDAMIVASGDGEWLWRPIQM